MELKVAKVLERAGLVRPSTGVKKSHIHIKGDYRFFL